METEERTQASRFSMCGWYYVKIIFTTRVATHAHTNAYGLISAVIRRDIHNPVYDTIWFDFLFSLRRWKPHDGASLSIDSSTRDYSFKKSHCASLSIGVNSIRQTETRIAGMKGSLNVDSNAGWFRDRWSKFRALFVQRFRWTIGFSRF